jgi:pimeloyl-ACP methyl ester carboxylesterase
MKCTGVYGNTLLISIVLAVALTIQTLESFAQEKLPRFEPTECFIERSGLPPGLKMECRWLVVPEDRTNPKSRAIRLAVVILRAREPDSSPPVVFLHGGPGMSGVKVFTPGIARAKFDHRSDIVIYDQRGAGFSEPKLCPEFRDVEAESQKLKTQREVRKFEKTAIRICVASLDQRIERSAYNTIESASDMIALRQLLGYSSWDVISDSYGARLAQEAMRRDTKGIRSVVMNKPVTRGPDFGAEVALSTQRAFGRVFADCNDQPDCHTAFPTLEKDFYEVYDDLNKTPLLVQIDSNGQPIVLDGKRFFDRLRNHVLSSGDPGRLTLLPLLVNEFRRGDKNRAARTLVGYNARSAVEGQFEGDAVLVKLVNCFDIYGKQFRVTRKTINAQVRSPFRRSLTEDCGVWQKRHADPSEWEPVRSDIPTLILTGRYDDRTPTAHAKRIASTLTRSYLYEFPDEAHGPPPKGCHAQIVRRFLADPFREPDASCISQLTPIKFATTWEVLGGPTPVNKPKEQLF